MTTAAVASSREQLPPPLRRAGIGAGAFAALALGFATLMFVRTADPFLLVAGLFAGLVPLAVWALVVAVRFAAGAAGAGGEPAVMLRCTACGHANPGMAKYCNECGRAV